MRRGGGGGGGGGGTSPPVLPVAVGRGLEMRSLDLAHLSYCTHGGGGGGVIFCNGQHLGGATYVERPLLSD